MGGTCPVSRLDRVLTAVSRITHEGRLLYLHDVRQLPGLIEKRLLWTLQPEENLKFTHYHEERNHQGKDNVLLFPLPTQAVRGEQENVRCRERLGDLLKYYERKAA